MFELATVLFAERGERRGDIFGRPLEWYAAYLGHGVVEGGQRVVHSGEQEEVHGGEEQERATLRQGRVVEEGQHSSVVGDTPADGWVDDATVAFDRGGEAAEVVGQRKLDQHSRSEAGRQERADGAEEEPEQNEHADRAHAPDHPALSPEPPGRVEDSTADHEARGSPRTASG